MTRLERIKAQMLCGTANESGRFLTTSDIKWLLRAVELARAFIGKRQGYLCKDDDCVECKWFRLMEEE